MSEKRMIKVNPARCASTWPGEYIGEKIRCAKSVGHRGRCESELGTYWQPAEQGEAVDRG
jgi:hypothetical protein